LLNLQRMTVPMLAQHHQLLIAIEISERDVGKEVPAKIGQGYRGECKGSRPGLSEFCNDFDCVWHHFLTGERTSEHRI
jgi:hypothetical protein